jgi:aspartate carbamoyltransferase catalytic subunit
MSVEARDLPRVPWTRRHLLGLEEYSREELLILLDMADRFVDVVERKRKKRNNLAGKVVVNLFFEPSTRTRTSFSLAARRLGADVLDFSSSGSSTSKGETFIDTAKNIEAMGIDLVVGALLVRRAAPACPVSRMRHHQRRRRRS